MKYDVHLPVCLSACLPACLSVCLPVCLQPYLGHRVRTVSEDPDWWVDPPAWWWQQSVVAPPPLTWLCFLRWRQPSCVFCQVFSKWEIHPGCYAGQVSITLHVFIQPSAADMKPIRGKFSLVDQPPSLIRTITWSNSTLVKFSIYERFFDRKERKTIFNNPLTLWAHFGRFWILLYTTKCLPYPCLISLFSAQPHLYDPIIIFSLWLFHFSELKKYTNTSSLWKSLWDMGLTSFEALIS